MAIITYNNFSFHIRHDGYPIMHNHEGGYEFILVLNGEILHKINGEREVLKQNTLCFLISTDKHSLEKITDSSIYISLTITDTHFDDLLAWISPSVKENVFAKYESFLISSERTQEILTLTNKILTSIPDVYYEFLNTLTCLLTHETLAYHYGRAATEKYHSAVAKFMGLLDSEQNLSLPLEKLIWETGYSYTHLNTLFLQDIGVSVGKVFSKKKLDYAIKCSNISLQKISDTLGFSTYSHFSSFFKKCTGISPLQYRQNSNVTINA